MIPTPPENPDYLSRQLITYIGNKRALLGFIGSGVEKVKKRLGKTKLDIFDVFSGSGAASRYFKQHARRLCANDIEQYAEVISGCYLSNKGDLDIKSLEEQYAELKNKLGEEDLRPGVIAWLYAPRGEDTIEKGERVFYTPRNARYIDTARALIGRLPEESQKFFLAPLLSEASIHANTSGVFKGFYKNRETGVGEYGGKNRDAVGRITGGIELPFPLFSNFDCEVRVFRGDANSVIKTAPEADLAYLDPPYNQHPYGSNYFMLNLIVTGAAPEEISPVSGIPARWQRSAYNKSRLALEALKDLVRDIKAKFVLVSFNSEGFIRPEEMLAMLAQTARGGVVEQLETSYNAFRGSRNLRSRPISLTEYLYLIQK